MPTTRSQEPTARLRALSDEYWRARLRRDPIEGTLLGYHEHDDRMPDESPEARAENRAFLVSLRARVQADVPATSVTGQDRITRDMLLGEVDSDIARLDCAAVEWSLDPREGPQVMYLTLAKLQPVKSPADARALLNRWRAMPAALDQKIANLRRGLAAGKTSARSETERVLRQLDELLARPDEQWPLVAPAQSLPKEFPAAEGSQFARDLANVVKTGIRPAFARLRDVVRSEVLPKSRGDAAVGISHLPGGDACYHALVQVHTSLSLAPKEIHDIGLAEIARIRTEVERLGPAAVGKAKFDDIRRKLQGKDPSLYFRSREEVESTARAAFQRAAAVMPKFLGHLPRTPCEVSRTEEYEEKDSTTAYYRPAPIDGTRPASYKINTYAPETRPRFEAEALAFHESIPGHHIQIAIAQEMTGVPEFRRQLGVTAFVEGWALYSERLAEELGLYSGPLDRVGKLSYEAWRAARLVVDTGMHALGWSRAQAIRYMTENTILAASNIENEVDRYIGWPGQALAYKLGELEIVRLRREAEKRQGASFDLRAFHDTVLRNGAVSLTVLREQVLGSN